MSVATIDQIRAQFPALKRIHNGHPVAYFDGPGGTQVPQAVVDAMSDYLLHHNANTYWAYPSSEETDAMLLAARLVFAEFTGGVPEEIVFGNNMTTITFHLARALGRRWNAGDEVIVTEIDHHANVAPWQALARERGIVLKWLPLNVETGQLELDKLPALLTKKTKLLAINAASNALGTVTDVTAAAELAHAAGALVFVDGVHYAPHFLPDVNALGADFFVCSPYKFYGPHTGVLWGRYDLLKDLDVPRLEPAPSEPPEHLETGTQNHEGIVGAAAAVEWLGSLTSSGGELRSRLRVVYEELHRREMALLNQLWDGLGAVKRVRRYGPLPDAKRTGTMVFTVAGRTAREVAEGFAEKGCFVSHGDFYATTIARKLGTVESGLVRVGAACYTTGGEIGRVVAAV